MVIDCLISLPKPVGRAGLARILAGSLRAPVTPDKARHHGRLKALGEEVIKSVVDELIEDDRLRQYERQGYSVLAPTLRGRAEAEAWLSEHAEFATVGPAPEAAESPSGDAETVTSEGDKYTALQKAIWLWRRRLAEAQGQPPYMIMGNELILQLAESRPQSLEELAALPGIGAQRLEHYGPTILDLIHLNPPQEGDAELLAAQRGAAKQPYTRPARVPPAVERKIFLKLQELRQKQAVASRSKSSEIASSSLLHAIAETAPETRSALDSISGFRSSGLAPIADQILAAVHDARATDASREPRR
jgi:ATP-dependent DNA helicase RecQ